MHILMSKDTRDVLGTDAKLCDSRSLYFDRFANTAAKDSGALTPRKDWFRRGITQAAHLSGRVVGELSYEAR
jgi:hypothetical protein